MTKIGIAECRPVPWIFATWVTIALTLLMGLAGCGASSAPNLCAGNVAMVDGTAITNLQYQALLKYTLGYFERGNSVSKYSGRRICGEASLRATCSSIKRQLLQRMIDQEIVNEYASRHNLLATSVDWTAALTQERKLIQESGGQRAFLAYLGKVGTDEAQFRFLESQEIETAKVMRALGRGHFESWLTARQHSSRIRRCPMS